MTWFIKMPNGEERPATDDEVTEIENPRWGAARKAALGGLAALSSEDPNQPSGGTKTVRNILVPRSPSTAAAMYGTLAAGELPAVAALPFYLRYPAVMGTGALISKLTGGSAEKGATQGFLSEGGTQATKLLGGVAGRIFRGSEVPSRNVQDRVATFIGDKLGIKIGGRDVESLLVRGGENTGLAAMARGNQKPAAQLLKRVFHDGWDYERGQVDQPALVNSILHDHWDELVQHLGKQGAQDLLNAVSGYPAGTLPGEAGGKLAALPSEAGAVRMHPSPSHVAGFSLHPFRTYRPPGPLDKVWGPQSESIMRGFATGGAAQAMPYVAPEPQIPPTPAAAPTPAGDEITNYIKGIPSPVPAARATPTRPRPSLSSLIGGTAYAQEPPGAEVLDPIMDPMADKAVEQVSDPVQDLVTQSLTPVLGPVGARDVAQGMIRAGKLYASGKLGGQAKRLFTEPGPLGRDVAAVARRGAQFARRPIGSASRAFVQKYGVRPGQAAGIASDIGPYLDPRETTRAALQLAKEHGPGTFKSAVQKLFRDVGGDEAMEILKPFYSSPEAQELFQNWEELVP